MLYAAYGSNLNKYQMSHRCPGAEVVTTGVIPGYRLLYKGSKSGSYLTIEPAPGCEVPVGIWRVTGRDIDALDFYEGYPNFYYKRAFNIFCDDGRRHRVFAYIMHEDRELGIPSPYYIDACMIGYEDFGFDPKYLDEALAFSRKGVVA